MAKRQRQVDVFRGRKRGVVITDPGGREYIARLGPGLEIVDGIIQVSGGGGGCDQLTAADPGGGGELVFTNDGDFICCEDP